MGRVGVSRSEARVVRDCGIEGGLPGSATGRRATPGPEGYRVRMTGDVACVWGERFWMRVDGGTLELSGNLCERAVLHAEADPDPRVQVPWWPHVCSY